MIISGGDRFLAIEPIDRPLIRFDGEVPAVPDALDKAVIGHGGLAESAGADACPGDVAVDTIEQRGANLFSSDGRCAHGRTIGNFPELRKRFFGKIPVGRDFSRTALCGMSDAQPKTILQRRLEERMSVAGEKPAPLATRLRLSDSFIRDILRGKTRSPRAESLEKLATALGTTSDYLLGRTDQAEIERGERTVPLVGYVGAGAAAHFYAAGDGNLGEVPAPEDATPETVAVEIRGDSLGSLFDQWLVFYDEVRSPVTHDLIGRLCVVGLPDDRILIKQIRPSKTPGLFHLLSNAEPPILDVEITWAAKVKSMVPR